METVSASFASKRTMILQDSEHQLMKTALALIDPWFGEGGVFRLR